jgi:hypothetical protein
VEVLRADVDQAGVSELLPSLEWWRVDRLQVVSWRIGVFEWHRVRQSILVELKSVMTGSTALEEIRFAACGRCRSLAAFRFPPTLRKLGAAFPCTAIAIIDLSGTTAESVEIPGMVFLAELFLPRRCILESVNGVPFLRLVTFGASHTGKHFAWHSTEVRFESLAACADFSRGILEARVYGEVACELRRETVPFPPP